MSEKKRWLKPKIYVLVAGIGLSASRSFAEERSQPDPSLQALQIAVERFQVAEKQYREAKRNRINVESKKEIYFRERENLKRAYSLYRANQIKKSYQKVAK